ncbi:MAG TPA: SRPBCC family protein [Solirubrobacterales bacterium]|nr:SRPBCC family protein [Solirubrobacterales bacterium]
MGPVSATIEIDAPRQRVFEVLCDLSLRPAFTDHFLSGFHLTRIDPIGVGAGARFRAQAPLHSPWMDTAIVEMLEPQRIVERGRGGRANRVPVLTAWELNEGPGSLTRVSVSQWTEPSSPVDRGVELLSGMSIWRGRGWREAMRRLRDLLESERAERSRVMVAGGNRHATGIP